MCKNTFKWNVYNIGNFEYSAKTLRSLMIPWGLIIFNMNMKQGSAMRVTLKET